MTAQPTPGEPTAGDRVRITIRALMAAQRLSGPTVAQRLGISSQILYTRLNGKTAITVDEADAFAALLDVPVAQLFSGKVTFGPKYAARDSNPEPTDNGRTGTLLTFPLTVGRRVSAA